MKDTNKKDDLIFEVTEAANAALVAFEEGNEEEAEDLQRELRAVCNKLAQCYSSNEAFEDEINSIKALLAEEHDEEDVEGLFD